jgi:hypothetical protein
MTPMAHQNITRTIGGSTSVVVIRDASDGAAKYSAAYESRGARWLSRHRFPEIAQAEAGALVLADFLGAEFRG